MLKLLSVELVWMPEEPNEELLLFAPLKSRMTITDFTLHFSCCFTKLLHSLFITLLNNFTM